MRRQWEVGSYESHPSQFETEVDGARPSRRNRGCGRGERDRLSPGVGWGEWAPGAEATTEAEGELGVAAVGEVVG